MALKGSIDETGLTDILLLLADSRRTGRLVVTHQENTGYVYFEKGNIIYASLVNRRNRLGDIFVLQGKITYEQLREAVELQEHTPAKRLGTILVDRGLVSMMDVENVIQMQIEETIYHLMKLEKGDFLFEPDVMPSDEEFRVSVNVFNLILEQARKIDEWNVMKKQITSLDLVLDTVEGSNRYGQNLEYTEAEKKILSLIDGNRDIQEIIDASGIGEYSVCKVLYSLLSAGMVRKVPGQKDRKTTFVLGDIREHINLGIAFLLNDMWEQSLSEMQRAQEIDPNSNEVKFYFGLLNQITGQYVKAAKEYHAILARDPRNVKVLTNIGFMFAKMGKMNLAQKSLEKAVKIDNRSAKALGNLGYVLFLQGQYTKALESLEKAVQLESDNLVFRFFLGLTLVKTGKYDLALAHFAGIFGKGRNDARIINNIGVTYWKKRMYDEAIAEFKKALDLDSSLISARANLANLYYFSGLYDEATQEYEKLLEMGFESPKIYLKLGNLCYRRREISEAKRHWYKCLELDSSNRIARSNLTMLKLLEEEIPDAF